MIVAHTYSSNAAEVGDRFVESIRSFGLKTDYAGKALGQLLADDTATGSQERSIEQQCDGSGSPWAQNSDNPEGRGYRSKKAKRCGTALTNGRTGQMLSKESLAGKVIITQYLVEMTYGTGQPPDRCANGAEPTEADKAITDDDKAFYAHEQGRRFFELDQDICNHNFGRFSAALGEHLRNPGR